MTKEERAKCENLMEEAIRNAEEANELFFKAEKTSDTVEKEVLMSKAHNHQGYAEGIHQALAVIGFKHERMRKLRSIL